MIPSPSSLAFVGGGYCFGGTNFRATDLDGPSDVAVAASAQNWGQDLALA